MKTLFSSVMIASLFALFAGCKGSGASTAQQPKAAGGSELLYQSQWKLIEVQDQQVPSASKAFLVFTPGTVNKVAGNAGCNRLTGTFELSQTNTIKFLPMATTRMACIEPGLADVETKFLAALTSASQWHIENDTLSLSDGNTVLAKLKSQRPPTEEEKKLNGTWELNYLSGTKIALEGLFPKGKPTLLFDFPKEEAMGNGGCNGYSSKVKVDQQKITFADPLSTMMFCEGNGEPQYFKALKTITSYSLSDNDNTLNLIAGDIAVMRFTRK